MEYEFLKSFHKRMEIVAIVEFLVSKISRKALFKDCGFDEDEATNLLLLVMCFIMEKSLLQEPCTAEDIASYIRTLDIAYLKKNIPDDKYPELTGYILTDCLQNGGTSYSFNTYNYESNKPISIAVKLIDVERIAGKNGNILSYYLTPQGDKFMFNTLEIEESMQVSMEHLKLSIQIKKRNFGSARDTVDNLFNICRSQVQRIEYFIKRVKEDIGSIGKEEYAKIYADTFESLKEQNEGHNKILVIINTAEESILNDETAKEDEKLQGDIDHIIYIKNKLKYIITEQTNLLLKQQELQVIYDEAIDNILYIGFENRLDMETALLERVENEPFRVNALSGILRPLFNPSPNKIFNINLVLAEQRIETDEEKPDDSNVLYDENNLNDGETEIEKKIQRLNTQYLRVMDHIIGSVFKTDTRRLALSKIVEQAKGFYEELVPSVRVLNNILIQLHNMKTVDVSKIIETNRDKIFSPSEEFDISYTMIQLVNKYKGYEKIKGLIVEADKEQTIAINEKQQDDGTGFYEQLVCPEIYFELEVQD